MSFYDIWQQLDWTGLQQAITESTPADVERALHRERRDLTDFAALISVAAEPFFAADGGRGGAIDAAALRTRCQHVFAALFDQSMCQ